MGVNPEDPAAMASIQRVASTFFNANEFQRSFKMNFKDEESKMSSKAKISR